MLKPGVEGSGGEHLRQRAMLPSRARKAVGDRDAGNPRALGCVSSARILHPARQSGDGPLHLVSDS